MLFRITLCFFLVSFPVILGALHASFSPSTQLCGLGPAPLRGRDLLAGVSAPPSWGVWIPGLLPTSASPLGSSSLSAFRQGTPQDSSTRFLRMRGCWLQTQVTFLYVTSLHVDVPPGPSLDLFSYVGTHYSLPWFHFQFCFCESLQHSCDFLAASITVWG